MNQQSRRPRRSLAAVRGTGRLAPFLLVAALCGCQRPAAPSPTAIPSPTPPALRTPSPTVFDALSAVDSEVRIYLLMVRPVTTDYAILYAREQPLSVLRALVEELELIQPPPDMVEAHALLKEGYQLLVEGGSLLSTQPRAETRSEAIFIQDWGVRQLREHRQVVDAYLDQIAGTEQP
jgi:hypothetical protein